ncbi:MAG: hypothetical protein HY908_20605 [Myxococcales bacterium]|nr:hypothetical protein [Myxococcales bacterium]
MCHNPPGDPSLAATLTVAEAAVPAHLAHGDTLGACPAPVDDLAVEPTLDAQAAGGPPGGGCNPSPVHVGCPGAAQCCNVGTPGKAAFGCVNTFENPRHCGSCGRRCPATAPDCDNGTCQCHGSVCTKGLGGFAAAYCADLQTDEANCGACGRACLAGTMCCDGGCIAVDNDPDNCGACGNRCALADTCCAGECASCNPGCEDPRAIYPVAAVNLSSACGISPHVIGGNWTYAWGLGDLGCVPYDGAEQTLSFTPGFPAQDPRQEAIAFDLDWAAPVVNPDPNLDNVYYVPVENDFASVPMGSTEQYTFPAPYKTAHIVRYWHGQCAVRTPWSEVFDPISSTLFAEFATGVDDSVCEATAAWRDWDRFAPSFIGHGLDIRHGFSFEAHYTVTGIGGVFGGVDIGIYMNPAYVFHVRPGDGLVELENVRQGVISIANTSALQAALSTTLPATVAKNIEDEATFLPPIHTPCTPGPGAQDGCYQEVVASGLLHDFFRPALVGTYGEDEAEVLATRMTAAVEKRNFNCVPVDPTSENTVCGFHPIFEAINVLPDVLEFVVAPEPLTRCSWDTYLLYSLLPTVIDYFGGDGSAVDFCHGPASRADGTVPVWQHGFVEQDVSYGGPGCP